MSWINAGWWLCYAFAGITLRGARVHNLQSVDVRIPRGKLTHPFHAPPLPVPKNARIRPRKHTRHARNP